MIGFWCLVAGVLLGWPIGYCHGLDIRRARRGEGLRLPPVRNHLTHAGSQGNVRRMTPGGSVGVTRYPPPARDRVLAPAASSSEPSS